MESKFNFYDFLAHFIPGFLAICAFALLFLTPSEIGSLMAKTEPYKYIVSTGLVLISYSVGHVISQLGSLLLERGLVRSWVGYPSENFFIESKKNHWIFRDYRRSHSKDFAKRVKEAYEAKFNVAFHHYDAFMTCFHFVKERSGPTLTRLNTFLAVYDFCRNTSMGLLLLTLGFVARGFVTTPSNFYYAAGALFFAVFFFYRYLKFYRQYDDEVFRTFYILSKL